MRELTKLLEEAMKLGRAKDDANSDFVGRNIKLESEITRLQALIPVWRIVDEKCKDGDWRPFRSTKEDLSLVTEEFETEVMLKWDGVDFITRTCVIVEPTHYPDFVMPDREEGA